MRRFPVQVMPKPGSDVGYYSRLARAGGLSLARALTLPILHRELYQTGACEMSYPMSNYAPWRLDHEFQRLYKLAEHATLVDFWRLWELWNLVSELASLEGILLEVGVWRGGSGALMGARAQAAGIRDRVYLCDTWEGVVKTGDVDTYYTDGAHADASREGVERLVEQFGLHNVELLQGIFPDETAGPIENERVRLCHIDVDVYRSAADVFTWTWPRLVSGGVVVFDDYGFSTTPGVTQFVNEQRGLPDRLVIHNLNGHGMIVKR